MSEKDARVGRAAVGVRAGLAEPYGSAEPDGVLGHSDGASIRPESSGVASDVANAPSLRVRVGVGAAIVLVVVALVASVLITALSPVGSTTVFDTRTGGPGQPPPASSGPSAAAPATTPGTAAEERGTHATVLVHVLGAVTKPGVYELQEGARVIDVVGRAGGFAADADQASVNLARVLTDGEQVRVLAVGEAAPAAGAGGGAGGGSGGAGGAGQAPGGTGSGSAGGGAGASLVNLNSATELDLDALPRIGPAMAARIVAWRTDNGPFTSVDDLLEVAGIGEKTLEGLRDLVTV